MVRILTLFLISSFCGASHLMAQDVHFSQFFHTPMLTSPANTGNFDGDWRFSANHRSQWRRIDKPYLTQALGFEHQAYLEDEQFTGGVQVVNDKSAGTLNVLKIYASGGYHKSFGKHTLHGGVQPGFVTKSFDPNAETYPSQFNNQTGQFDNTLPSNETGLQENLSYFDLNFGLGYTLDLGKLKPFLSLGLYHLTNPKETFAANDNRLKVRKVASGGLTYSLTEKLDVEPMFFLMGTTETSDLVAGSNVNYLLQENILGKTSVYAGLFYRDGFDRNWDAFFITAGVKYRTYTFGVSYDYNVSDLKVATDHRGALEFSLIIMGLNTRLNRIRIPCDRY